MSDPEVTREIGPDAMWWISWYSDTAMSAFELHSPWWVSGYDADGNETVVAAAIKVHRAAIVRHATAKVAVVVATIGAGTNPRSPASSNARPRNPRSISLSPRPSRKAAPRCDRSATCSSSSRKRRTRRTKGRRVRLKIGVGEPKPLTTPVAAQRVCVLGS